MNDPLPELPLLLHDVPSGLRQALAQEGVPHVDRTSGCAGRFVLFDSRRAVPVLDGRQIGIDLDHLRRGRSRDPFEALADERAARHEWRIGGLVVYESVARVDRRAVRSRLLADLRVLLESAGGLWLSVARYPHPHQSAFSFRLDHDDYDETDFNATLAAICGYEHSVSHYVCMATHAPYPEALARLRGMHVGSHGWWHHTYREKGDNLANIRRGIESLHALGLGPVGFAAPHGRFHRGLLEALDELGVSHSSEFGLAYDDLPFFPGQSNVLQIPIHPVCLGVCLEAARRAQDKATCDADVAAELLEHWQAVMVEKHRTGEPIIFYGHPDRRLGRFPQLLRDVLDAAAQLPNTWCTTLANFEAWWRARSAVRLMAVGRGQQIEITSRGLPADHRVAVEIHRGQQVAAVELDRATISFSTGSLPWRTRQPPRTIRPAMATHSPGLRAGLRLYLDWERVTPIEEINADNWRGWAKRTLRRMRA
ncbi:MAG TPA: hypothetical protein VNH11_12825 [Pirellulales bacterium]|nr:hypothetical protein [Pirellulales bacterium]